MEFSSPAFQELISASIQEIKRKVIVDIQEYQEAFAELQVDIKTMLSTELTRDAVTLFLNSNLISAYLITTSYQAQLFEGLLMIPCRNVHLRILPTRVFY